MATGAHEHALVVGADVMSSIIDYKDRATCVLFGDGAGAVVVSAAEDERRARFWISSTRSTGAAATRSSCRAAAACGRRRTRPSTSGCTTSSRTGARCSSSPCARPRKSRNRILERNGLKTSDLDLFVSHQANRRIIESAAEKLGLSPDKMIINIDKYGNTTAATIPLALNDAVCSGRLKKGDLVLLASVGAGFTVGAVLLRWGF